MIHPNMQKKSGGRRAFLGDMGYFILLTLRGNVPKNDIFEKTGYILIYHSPFLLVSIMGSMIPQLFTIVEL